MNNIEIRYSYFSSKPEVKLNGEAISQYSDLATIVSRPFLESAANMIRELDENEICDDYEIDIYSTLFQYEIIYAIAKGSKYCKAVRFHTMESLFSKQAIIKRLSDISSQHNIKIEKRQPHMIYNTTDVDIPQDFFLHLTDKPNADVGIFEDSNFPSTVRFPIVITNSFEVSSQTRRSYYGIPQDKIDLFWEYYEIEFFIIPIISEYLTALKYVELTEAQNIELNAIKTGKPTYYISDIPTSIDQGASFEVKFVSFPEGYYSLISENSNILEYKDDQITAKNSGAINISVVDSNGSRLITKYINVIEHHYAQEIRLVPRFKYLGRNERGQIDIIVTPSNAEDANKLSWSVSDPRIIQVNENGNIVALEDGVAKITVEGRTTKAELTVEIKPVLRSLSFTKQSIRLKGGETIVIECNITPSNAQAENLVWEVDNKVIATANPSIDGLKCQITASSTYEGTGNIRCYDPVNRVAASCKLEVMTQIKHTTAGKITKNCMWWGIIVPILLPVSIIAGIYGLCTDEDPDHRPRYTWCTIISTIILLIFISAMR